MKTEKQPRKNLFKVLIEKLKSLKNSKKKKEVYGGDLVEFGEFDDHTNGSGMECS